MDIAIVTAVAENRVIGIKNRLPWKLRGELELFSSITRGHPIIMGRKTYISLPHKPLTDRLNIVISRNFPAENMQKGIIYVKTIAESLIVAEKWEKSISPKIMIIGGAEIYRLFLPLASWLYYTRVYANPEGDVFFPKIDLYRTWQYKSTLAYQKAESGYLSYRSELWYRRLKD